MTLNEKLSLSISLLSLTISLFGTRFWFLISFYRRWLCRNWKGFWYIGPGPEALGLEVQGEKYVFEDYGDRIIAIPKTQDTVMRCIYKTSITQIELHK